MMKDIERFEENTPLMTMCRDFLIRTGANGNVCEICTRLVKHMDEGNACLKLTDCETEEIRKFSAVSAAPDDSGIFILDGKRLYTRRYWKYEDCIRRRIKNETPQTSGNISLPDDPAFNALHPCQREAVKIMCSSRLSILTGGPGTGKTYTIARAVKLAGEKEKLRIGLAAPTGKAAARVNESMNKEIASLNLQNIGKATTIHSLLKPCYTGVTFKHNADDPLPLDWVIVDEASMIDLPLMAKLLDALPEHCRLTLVGDQGQLASVEPGRVFGDLCKNSSIAKCELDISTRFPAGGIIDRFSKAVNAGDDAKMLAMLHEDNELLHFRAFSGKDNLHPGKWQDFTKLVTDLWTGFASQTTPQGALEKLNDCRLLCALRSGPFGAEKMNEYISLILNRKFPDHPVPVMITGNDRALDVWNGDVGVIMPGENQLCLPDRDPIPLELLPDTEKAFASTIHKAQGSEYRNVMILLPDDSRMEESKNAGSLLTRELLYTAVTRTRERVFIYGGEETLRSCCRAAVERDSGL